MIKREGLNMSHKNKDYGIPEYIPAMDNQVREEFLQMMKDENREWDLYNFLCDIVHLQDKLIEERMKKGIQVTMSSAETFIKLYKDLCPEDFPNEHDPERTKKEISARKKLNMRRRRANEELRLHGTPPFLIDRDYVILKREPVTFERFFYNAYTAITAKIGQSEFSHIKLLDMYSEQDKEKVFKHVDEANKARGFNTNLEAFLIKQAIRGATIEIISSFGDAYTCKFYRDLLSNYFLSRKEHANAYESNGGRITVKFMRRSQYSFNSIIYALLEKKGETKNDGKAILFFEPTTQWSVIEPEIKNRDSTFVPTFWSLLDLRFTAHFEQQSAAYKIVELVKEDILHDDFKAVMTNIISDIYQFITGSSENAPIDIEEHRKRKNRIIRKINIAKIMFPNENEEVSILFHTMKFIELIMRTKNLGIQEDYKKHIKMILSQIFTTGLISKTRELISSSGGLYEREFTEAMYRSVDNFIAKLHSVPLKDGGKALPVLERGLLWNEEESVIESFNIILEDRQRVEIIMKHSYIEGNFDEMSYPVLVDTFYVLLKGLYGIKIPANNLLHQM